ncbi:MAG: YhfC family intramembrane metalloprotease [Chloroflexia bacterium]|nr:YhfC family intramembrane metalloprotease [Chloroflexia bacterium]
MIVASYVFAGLLMILLPVLLALLLRRRFRVPWLLFLVGGLTFAVSQAVHLPLNHWFSDLGVLPPRSTLEGPPLWRTALILGLTAGLCEELARAAGYALLRRYRRFQDALMLGLGHGGLEAMVIGGITLIATVASLWALRGADLQGLGLSPAQFDLLRQQLQIFEQNPLLALAPLLERILAMAAHLVFSLLVWRAFQRRRAGYVLAAIAYHAVIDAVVVYAGQQLTSGWLVEALFAAMLLPGLLWMGRLWSRQERSHHPGLFRQEWAGFVQACRKELLQQWRTKRLLVVLAVFVLFGLSSPLLAHFMPELLGSLEGAEQFAELVPEPTVADAMGQYVKNLTQFGFILAILLGMGAVAEEKDKGTAALMLSKPLPRWAFVLSKFVAQTAVYLLAFAIAALGAAYYSWILFDSLDVGGFVVVNLLLLLWLLVFVAVTLLGSTLSRSIGAAAGIGLAGSVVLLLSGSLPRVGALAPGGLVNWAGQIGQGMTGQTVTPNGGAAAMSLVLIQLCLVGALAAFEQQEL